MGCKLYYGDTDSIYISCPLSKENDRLYYSNRISKLEYCTRLVNETFEVIDVVKNRVNEQLILDNGTTFKVRYEEVLFFVIFMVKKVYAGIEHTELVKFDLKGSEIFTRGLSVNKKDSSGY